MSWTPTHVHTPFSLLDGFCKPDQVANRCEELGYTACTITDHGSASGAIAFMTKMQKKNINQPIMVF